MAQDDTRNELYKQLVADLDKVENLSHDFHKHYRASATAIAVTTIGLSSAGIIALKDLGVDPAWLKLIPLVVALVTIFLALHVQNLHYTGYQQQARWASAYRLVLSQRIVGLLMNNDQQSQNSDLVRDAEKEATDSYKQSTIWFDELDKWAPRALNLFRTTFILFAVIIAVSFFQQKPASQPVGAPSISTTIINNQTPPPPTAAPSAPP